MTPLDPPSLKRALRLCLIDGAVFALMVGMGETYFLANAVRLQASPIQLGWLVTLPLCLGALGPMLTLAALQRLKRRKAWTVGSVLLQAGVLLSISILDYQGRLTVWLLIGAACLYQVTGMSAGTAWSSWFGDLVPTDVRGRYFSRRNRFVQVSTLLGLVASGLLLQWLEPSRGSGGGVAGAGFQLIFALAAGIRLVSAALLSLSPEGPFGGLSKPKKLLRFAGTPRGQTAWRLLLAAASLQMVTYIASPYFTPFMFNELQFTYIEYMIATIFVVAGKFFILPLWGRAIDTHGARPVYLLVAIMVALVPVPWLFARDLWTVIPAQMLSGATWAGYEVSYFSLLLDSSFKSNRAYVFAAQNVLNGTGQLIGATVGGALLGVLSGDFQMLFGISILLRMTISMLMPRAVPARRSVHVGRRDLALRLVGFRSSGGVVHRPIFEGGDDAADGDGEDGTADE